MDRELAAIKAIDFNWVRPIRSIWTSNGQDVQTLNGPKLAALADAVFDGDRGSESNAQVGQVVIGPAGIGKTHLLGGLREKVWERGGWFILLDIIGIKDFWTTAALSYLQSLQQPYENGLSQGDAILSKLCLLEDVGRELARKSSLLQTADGKEIFHLMESVLRGLAKKHKTQIVKYGTVIGAFVLLQGRDRNVSSQAYSWLQGIGVDELPLKNPVSPFQVVEAISWLISLTGPTVLAVDQLDPIVSYHNLIASGSDALDGDEERQAQAIIEGLCRGLSEIFEVTLRTTTVLSCLEATWQILIDRALKSFEGRFDEPVLLDPITGAQAAEELITARTTEAYQTIGINPPYPSWPIAKGAFATAVGLLPRDILRRCDAHRRKCITNRKVIDLMSFAGPVPVPPPGTPIDSSLDTRFAALRASADIAGLCNEEREEELPDLLLTALECHCLGMDIPNNVDLAVEGDPHKRKPSLHARLRRIYRAEGDREEHHCFRAIPHANAVAFQSRLKAAMTAAGIHMSLAFRHLFVIRRGEAPSGAKTRQLCDTFKEAGGKFTSLTDGDLKIMVALQTMMKERPDGFEPWLKQRKPLCDIAMFREAGLCGAHVDETLSAARAKTPPAPESRAEQPSPAVEQEGKQHSAKPTSSISIFIGRRLIGGHPEQGRYLALDLLPRHTAVLAGSGSGKTVLLRRMIEEAALLGVPAIVLDTNNDLAMLGDPWPELPAVWDDSDRDKAKQYAAKVEVVVWTPGIAGGNPIMLAPMPDFGPVRGDEDELRQTVAMAQASLEPLIGATGAKAKLKGGILMQALRYFAPSGEEGLDAFVRLLSDLPPEVSDIGNAQKLAGEMADHFKAEIAKNPLLSFKGTPLDPKVLFTAKDKSKTRISVINFSGLPADDAKQSFVNQLEMALFSWIKQNPTPSGRPLTGLLVMDEAQNFAPAQKSTPCKESTIALAAQARKYGLGMIFATQVPKNIDNKIISNCTTHFYGKMNAPATIEAVRELMAAKGGGGSDIGSLKAGEFYFATEGMSVAEKVKTPLCLSYHPPNPLPQEEVVKRAKASA